MHKFNEIVNVKIRQKGDNLGLRRSILSPGTFNPVLWKECAMIFDALHKIESFQFFMTLKYFKPLSIEITTIDGNWN
jgi:hypothetical protein